MTWTSDRVWTLAAVGAGGASFAAFTVVIGAGQPSGPGVFLAASVATLVVTARMLFQAARMLVRGGIEADDDLAVGRRRKELEREYYVLRRALKELELDRAMGKVSVADYQEIRGRYRERAVRILRQLDQQPSFTAQIEADLQARRAALPGHKPKAAKTAEPNAKTDAAPEAPVKRTATSGGADRLLGAGKDRMPEAPSAPSISIGPTISLGPTVSVSAPTVTVSAPTVTSTAPTDAAPHAEAAPLKATVPAPTVSIVTSTEPARLGAPLIGEPVMHGASEGTDRPRKNKPGQDKPRKRRACPRCATKNDSDAAFCKKCGQGMAS